MKNRLLHLFNIRQEEAGLVTNLFWLQFFQGAGVAIFNSVVLALFIKHFDVLGLPKVYLFSAILLWVFGYVYSKVEHALSIKKLVPLVILFVAFSILAFSFKYSATNSSWFLFLMLAWYYVVYLLTNLEFWGLAALQFDIRQSKRLFGMIGAGDIPAKLIGYSLVPILVKFFSAETTIAISAVSILMSLVFYFRLKNTGKMDMHVSHGHAHSHHHATENFREVLKGFFGNRMIAFVALLSFIVMTCVTIISFSFYAEIKHEMMSDAELYGFISMFFVGGRVLAIFIRLILTGRLANLLGTKGSLLVSPIILLLFLITFILLSFFALGAHSVIYFFGLMFIITEVLKTSLQDPVFLSLMQPLSSNLRLKGHTIVKGVMDPFALAFSGVMLYTLVKLSGKVDLYLLSYLLFVLLIVWIVMIFLVDREYVKTLVTALNRRYSIGQEIDLSDEKTKAVLLDKISAGECGEAIYILNLVERQYSEEQQDLVIKALEHPKIEVKMEAIKMAERRKITAVLPQIEKMIEQKTDTGLLPEAVKAMCMLQPDALENFDVFVENEDHRLMKAAIIGLMTSGGINAVVTAGQKLLQMIASFLPEERKTAAEIIGELGVQSFYKPLIELMKDENGDVVKAAIIAAGKVKNEKLVAPLMQFFLHTQYEKSAAYALQESGDVSLKEIRQALTHGSLNHQKQSKLILICGKIGNEHAINILDDLVWKLPSLRYDIFHALHLCEFRSQPHHKLQHVKLMHQYIDSATRILFMIHVLKNKDTARVLTDALYLEMNEIRDLLLLLFSFVYDREKMVKAKNTFQIQRKESMANALEIIEIEVPKEISLRFIRLFEPGNLEEKYTALQSHFKEELKYETIVDEILHNQKHYFHRWTKAAALYSLNFYHGKDKRGWLEWAQGENDLLLKQTAQQLLSQPN
ncbi:MAG: MFS transporter [Bacteroidota bacterium]